MLNAPAVGPKGRFLLDHPFSPEASVAVERVGREEQPLVIIDDALAAPEALVGAAVAKSFAPIGPYFPGVRAPVDAGFADALTGALAGLIRETFAVEAEAWTREIFFSLVTTPPERLAPIQRLPHYDGIEKERLAILYYLSRPEQGGTSFYRHETTGFETVTADRFPAYKTALEVDVRAHGLPPAQYVDDGAPLFTRIAKIEARFNRMLIYRGVNLHCSTIDDASTLSADPKTGRLTINAFLQPGGTK